MSEEQPPFMAAPAPVPAPLIQVPPAVWVSLPPPPLPPSSTVLVPEPSQSLHPHPQPHQQPQQHPIQSRRRSVALAIPPQLVKPGMEMLKISTKSSRRVKSRKIWLERGGDDQPTSGAAKDLKLCWEKSWRGVGPRREECLSLSAIRDFRIGTSGSPYRTALHLSPSVESRWLTLIYLAPTSGLLSLLPSSVNAIAGSTTTASYKMLHFIAPSVEALNVWRELLDKFRDVRSGGGSVVVKELEGPGAEEAHIDPDCGDVTEHRTVKVDEVHKLCARLGMGMKKEEIDAAFKEAASPKDTLDFSAFQNFVKLLKRRADIEAIFRTASGGNKNGLGKKDWEEFCGTVQKMKITPEALDGIYSKYADLETGVVNLDGFTHFLLSSDTPSLIDESAQDMKRPLSEYFISSSHNTYLVGNQLQGESTVEGYIRALQRGCRCVELDIWPGDDGFPIVTHGRTLTSKLTARDALSAIAKYAFLASPYPLILSIEIHCDPVQQDRLVEIFKETLGDRLLTERIDGKDGEIEVLPSPWDLRGKVLIKAKNLFVTTTTGTQHQGIPIEGGPNAPIVDSESSTESSSASSDSELKRAFNAVRRTLGAPTSAGPIPVLGRSSSSSSSSPSPGSLPLASAPSSQQPSTKAPKPPMSAALAAVIVYTVGVKARGFNKKETYGTTHVLSFGEGKLSKMLKEDVLKFDLTSHNRGHLTRSYPKGIRVTSTNYLPHHLWAVGVQMVAINWQTFDLGMALNTAMFARAGRTGYVLKPELLRQKGTEKDKDTLNKTAEYVLKLQVISAQQLPRLRESDSGTFVMDPFIEVGLHVPGATSAIKRRSKVICGNAFNPTFSSEFNIPFTTNPAEGMLDLVFLRFEVLNAKGNIKAANDEGKGDFVGAYTTSLGCLPEGYRHLPLYDAIGDQHLFSSIFVRSSIVPAPPPGSGSLSPVTTPTSTSFGATLTKTLSRSGRQTISSKNVSPPRSP